MIELTSEFAVIDFLDDDVENILQALEVDEQVSGLMSAALNIISHNVVLAYNENEQFDPSLAAELAEKLNSKEFFDEVSEFIEKMYVKPAEFAFMILFFAGYGGLVTDIVKRMVVNFTGGRRADVNDLIMLSAASRAKYAEILTWLMIETMLLVIEKMMEKQFAEKGDNDARDEKTVG